MRDIGRAVPALAFGILRVDFDELREVAAVAERGGDRRDVRLESIGADLESLPRGRGPQPFNEGVRRGLAAAPEGEIQNELRSAFDSDEAVGIANTLVVGFRRQLVPFFLVDVAPDLIALNVVHRDIHNHPAHELLALLAHEHEQAQNRVAVQFGCPFDGAD